MPSFYMNAPDCICSPGRLPLGAFCAGRDDLEREALHDDRISIRAPRAGCDQAAATKKGFMSEFQSTRPVWGATVLPASLDGSRLFQSTRPVWGATISNAASQVDYGISIHAPRVGRDFPPAAKGVSMPDFNPRAPCGARRAAAMAALVHQSISIHAPRVGRDVLSFSFARQSVRFQSTRPVWGATRRAPSRPSLRCYFNPRAPCGARPFPPPGPLSRKQISIHAPRVGRDTLLVSPDLEAEAFQSTRPVWGATLSAARPALAETNFNPRAPCGARHDYLHDKQVDKAQISIHAPRVGRDCSYPISPYSMCISIHAPRVGRDRIFKLRFIRNPISIHAPRVGRDWYEPVGHRQGLYFNPRAPCGARRARFVFRTCRQDISIHAPRVGRDGALSLSFSLVVISIHAPRVGRDRWQCSFLPGSRYFNPRAPCGARQAYTVTIAAESDFNPRAPCGARPLDVAFLQSSPPNFNPRAPCGARPRMHRQLSLP